jgi:hypothetical protein
MAFAEMTGLKKRGQGAASRLNGAMPGGIAPCGLPVSFLTTDD